MTRKSSKHLAQHSEPLDSCLNLIRSHQQLYTVISPTGNRTSDNRIQSWSSTTELLVHIPHKQCQIN